MTQYYISAANGTDTASGTVGAPVKTVYAGLGKLAAKGDILNICNDGIYTWPVTMITLADAAGTNFTTDYGYLIRGMNAAGTEEDMVTITATGANGNRYFFRYDGSAGYHIIENLIFDASAKISDTGYYRVIIPNSNSAKPILVRYGALIGAASGQTPAARRCLYDSSASLPPNDSLYIKKFYFQNTYYPIYGVLNATQFKFGMDHCVFIRDKYSPGSLISQNSYNPSTSDDVDINHNTIYDVCTNCSTALADVFSIQPQTNTDVGTFKFHSNILYQDSDKVVTPINAFLSGGSKYTCTHTGTIGYNVIQYGENITAGEMGSKGVYSGPWDPDNSDSPEGDDVWDTDEFDVGVAASDLFLHPTTAYTWEVSSSPSRSIPILYDLRPSAFLTAAADGGVPGALPAGETDYTVGVAASRNSPYVEDQLTLTVNLSNSGEDASDVVLTTEVPSGLTYVSNTPSQGTYSTATNEWSVGAVADSGTASLAIVANVDTGEEGSAITFSATFTSGDPPTGGDTTDDSASTVINVMEDDPSNPLDPSATPYIDVLPLKQPDLRKNVTLRMKSKVNRQLRRWIEVDEENDQWREFTSKRLELGASSSTLVNLGGIQRGKALIVESTTGIQISVGDATNLYGPDTLVLALAGGDFEKVYLKNTHTATAATVLIGVVD